MVINIYGMTDWINVKSYNIPMHKIQPIPDFTTVPLLANNQRSNCLKCLCKMKWQSFRAVKTRKLIQTNKLRKCHFALMRPGSEFSLLGTCHRQNLRWLQQGKKRVLRSPYICLTSRVFCCDRALWLKVIHLLSFKWMVVRNTASALESPSGEERIGKF